jgi:hypothetical protein
MTTTPARAFELRDSEYDWGYKATMIKRPDYERIEKPHTRGKVLGGCSALNYFIWGKETFPKRCFLRIVLPCFRPIPIVSVRKIDGRKRIAFKLALCLHATDGLPHYLYRAVQNPMYDTSGVTTRSGLKSVGNIQNLICRLA